jgi:transposase
MSMKGTVRMIVIGVDVHKSSHCAAAVCAVTGELRSSETVAAVGAGHRRALEWARGLDRERTWAIEDCRHVSGGLERFLVARGERVVRVAPARMAAARRGQATRGKSDPIDALAVARAALAEGPDRLPAATVDERAEQIRLLVDYHDDLVAQRSDDQRRLRWHLHDLWPELEIPAGALDRDKWLDKLAGRLRRAGRTTRVRIARELVVAIRRRTRRVRELERELADLVAEKAPQLLAETGCGALTAARIVAEVGDVTRFSSDAKLARLAGIAPIPASSGRTDRHRLDRGGNRKLNCAIHRLAVNKGRLDPTTAAYLARRQAEGKNRMEALRCLKRHLARRIYRLLTQTHTPPQPPNTAPTLT